MLSFYPTRFMKTEKLWEDFERLPDLLMSVENYLNAKDFLALPTIALGALNKIPVNGFYPEEELWFCCLHVEWLAKREKFLRLALFERGENVMVSLKDYCGKFSPDVLLYSRRNPINIKQQCQSWLVDRGNTCNIQSVIHLKQVMQEMLDFEKSNLQH